MQPSLVHVIDEATADRLAELFRALGDPHRVRIVATLLQGECNVRALAQAIGLSESAVSHHLRHLRQLRLARARKQGRHVFYRLDDEHIQELLLRSLDHVQHD